MPVVFGQGNIESRIYAHSYSAGKCSVSYNIYNNAFPVRPSTTRIASLRVQKVFQF